MKRRTKILAGLLALVLAFSGGLWVGLEIDTGDVDPQDYITTVFTPYDDGLQSYLEFLDYAQDTCYIAAYAYTHPKITDKLIELKKVRGVEVRILIDRSQSKNKYSQAQIRRLKAAGIEVVTGTSAKYGQLMHHKYTVIDGVWVYTGSWNFSKSANKQANNLDFMKSRKRARRYLANWHEMYRFMKAQQP